MISNSKRVYFDGSNLYSGRKSTLIKREGFSDITLKYLLESKLDFLVCLLDRGSFNVDNYSDTSLSVSAESKQTHLTHLENLNVTFDDSGIHEIILDLDTHVSASKKYIFTFSEEPFNPLDISNFTVVKADMPLNLKPQVFVDMLVLARRSIASEHMVSSKGQLTLNIFNGLFLTDNNDISTLNADFSFLSGIPVKSLEDYTWPTGLDLNQLLNSFKIYLNISVPNEIAHKIYLSSETYKQRKIIRDIDTFEDCHLELTYLGSGDLNYVLLSKDLCYDTGTYNIGFTINSFIFDNYNSGYYLGTYFFDQRIATENKNPLRFLSEIFYGLESKVTSDYVSFSLNKTALDEISTIFDDTIPNLNKGELKFNFDSKGQFSNADILFDNSDGLLFTFYIKVTGKSTLEDFDGLEDIFNSYKIDDTSN